MESMFYLTCNYTVWLNRRTMNLSRNRILSPVLGSRSDFPAVIGNRSGAGWERYAFARVLCALRNT